jgi:8-oxo-dGTP pyrophosphatase MutT (NUDIX family)
MSDKPSNAAAVAAATILLLRDGGSGLEVFMVKRHHQIDFATGALVFPGGKATAADHEPEIAGLADGAKEWPAVMIALAACAVREAFEESGILLARDISTGELVSGARTAELAAYRSRLDSGELSLNDFFVREGLRLACDRLVHFAHWITPRGMPKRFDTHFFAARAPQDQVGRHDGRESVDSIWIKPLDAVADRKRWNVIFPTKLNLQKLAQSNSVDDAIARALSNPPVTVEPWIEDGPDGKILRIRDDAGYEQISASLRDSV